MIIVVRFAGGDDPVKLLRSAGGSAVRLPAPELAPSVSSFSPSAA